MYARVDLSISLDVDAIQQYSRSKLYYDLENRRQFTEDNVVAFQVQKSNSKESVLIRLPFALAEKQIISLRLDPLPDCHNSNFEIFSFSLLREDELTIDEKNRADHDYQKKQRHKKWMEGLRNKTRLTGMCLEVTLDQPVELEVHTSDLEEVELTGKPTAQSLETAVLETGIVADHVRNMDYKCVYMHRTGVVLSNGEVNTCAAPYVKTVGSLQNQSFGEIWLGKDMQNIRQDIGTVKEWKQCKNCWFREINYRNQRRERHSGRVFDYSEGSQYTLDAWDFRGYEGRTDIIAKN